MEELLLSAHATYCKPDTFAEFVTSARTFLRRLRTLDPAFRDLAVLSHQSLTLRRIDPEAADFGEVIADAANDTDSPERFQYLDELGNLTAKSLCRIGFSATFYSFDKANGAGVSCEEGGVQLTLQG